MNCEYEVITQKEKKRGEFPCLQYYGMEGDPKTIVLFTKLYCGMVVYDEDNRRIGEYREDWIMSNFMPVPVGTQVTIFGDDL